MSIWASVNRFPATAAAAAAAAAAAEGSGPTVGIIVQELTQ